MGIRKTPRLKKIHVPKAVTELVGEETDFYRVAITRESIAAAVNRAMLAEKNIFTRHGDLVSSKPDFEIQLHAAQVGAKLRGDDIVIERGENGGFKFNIVLNNNTQNNFPGTEASPSDKNDSRA